MTQPPDLIVHIGHYKTGTTALQVFCAANRDLLARQGLLYAERPLKHAKHSALALSLLHQAGVTTLMHGYQANRPAAELWADVFAQARAQAGGTLLISSEEFIRLGAHPAAVEGLRAAFATAPDLRVRVIAYLRPPQAHLTSWFNQLVKMGVRVDAFEAAIPDQIEAVHWDYARALRPWVDLVGANNVILRPFDDALRQGDALFEDFLEALGFSLPILAQAPQGDPNPRLDDRLVEIRRALTNSGLARPVAEAILTRARAALTEDGAAHDAIAAQSRAGIEALTALGLEGFDPAPLLADLPRPRPPAQRDAAHLVGFLTGELAHLRIAQRQLALRLARLEQHLPDPAPDPAPDAKP